MFFCGKNHDNVRTRQKILVLCSCTNPPRLYHAKNRGNWACRSKVIIILRFYRRMSLQSTNRPWPSFFFYVPLVAFPVTVIIPVVSWWLIRSHQVKNYLDPSPRTQIIIDFTSKNPLKSINIEIFIINHTQVTEKTLIRWPIHIQVHAYDLYGPTRSKITPIRALEHKLSSISHRKIH